MKNGGLGKNFLKETELLAVEDIFDVTLLAFCLFIPKGVETRMLLWFMSVQLAGHVSCQ